MNLRGRNRSFLSLIVGLALALVVSGILQPAPAMAKPASGWKYTALGDSLATGFGAFNGYVPRYKDYTQADTGMSVSLTNLGQNGWTSADLLKALKTNRTFRNSVSRSQVVTWDIGGNDWLNVRDSYKAGTCGGTDNQDCLRSAIGTFKVNWDAIMTEILSLRSTSNTAIRTMDLYNPYVNEDTAADTWAEDGGLNDFLVFQPYIADANNYISATATNKNIPYAQVYLAFNGSAGDEDPSDKGYIGFDGLYPNDTGHRVIADLLRGLQYAPLK